MSALVAAEVSIRGAVNPRPLSIAERTKTSNKSPNKCHRGHTSLYFHCAWCCKVQLTADSRQGQEDAVNIEELSLNGDI